jgi:antitoxin PrlF
MHIDGLGMYSYTQSMKSIVGERGQVTIPKRLRDRLGIRQGDRLEFEEDQGRLIAVKAEQQDAVDAVYGKLRLGRPTDQLVERLRGKPDAV